MSNGSDTGANIFSDLLDVGVEAFGETEFGKKVVARQRQNALVSALQDPMNLLIIGVILFFAVRGIGR
jgi:hypothetical protein